MIEVTAVDVYPLKQIKEGSKMLAFARIVLNDEFVVASIRILDGENGLFIGFPQQKDQNEEGKYHDLAFPITKEARTRISDAVLEEHANPTEKGARPQPTSEPAPQEQGSKEPNWD